MSLLALTRAVSPSIADCQLSHLERVRIDVERAGAQHAAYEAALTAAGCRVQRVAPLPQHPDAVFVEDTCVVLDPVAVIMRPGAPSRQGEVASVESAVARHRPLRHLRAPGTMDGGDVLVVGDRVYVGRTARTNDAGIEQLRAHLLPFGMEVRAIDVHGCLHLKTAVTVFGAGRLLINPTWVDVAAFVDHDQLAIDPREPFAANVLMVGEVVLVPEAHPRTAARLRDVGVRVVTVPADELSHAEGGVTCCSVILTVEVV